MICLSESNGDDSVQIKQCLEKGLKKLKLKKKINQKQHTIYELGVFLDRLLSNVVAYSLSSEIRTSVRALAVNN